MTAREFVGKLPICAIFRNTVSDTLLMRVAGNRAVGLDSGAVYEMSAFPNDRATHPYTHEKGLVIGELIEEGGEEK